MSHKLPNAESHHFYNWLLRSGTNVLSELIMTAHRSADEMAAADDSYATDVHKPTRDELSRILSAILKTELTDRFLVVSADEDEGSAVLPFFDRYPSAKDYRRDGSLLLALLSEQCKRIDLDAVANALLTNVPLRHTAQGPSAAVK